MRVDRFLDSRLADLHRRVLPRRISLIITVLRRISLIITLGQISSIITDLESHIGPLARCATTLYILLSFTAGNADVLQDIRDRTR